MILLQGTISNVLNSHARALCLRSRMVPFYVWNLVVTGVH